MASLMMNKPSRTVSGNKTNELAEQARRHLETGASAQALGCAQKLVKRAPRSPAAYHILAVSFYQTADYAKAMQACTRALQLDPDYGPAILQAARTYQITGDADHAKIQFQRCLSLDPHDIVAQRCFLTFCIEVHDTARALELASSIRAVIPHDTHALAALVALRNTDGFPYDKLSLMDEIGSAFAATSDPSQKSMLAFNLATLATDLEKFDAAFRHYQTGNRLIHEIEPYDFNTDLNTFRILNALYGEISQQIDASVERPASKLKQRPIMVIGMPRSGTSLVEQILASHSRVFGAGELPYLIDITRDAMARITLGAPVDGVAFADRIAHTYEHRLQGIFGTHDFIVDKMPTNYKVIGMLMAARPDIRIVHVKRDPMAVCWSIFSNRFENQNFSNNLSDIIKQYRLYREYIRLQEKLFPARMLTLDYDVLTRDQEQQTRRLLDYCGLAFEQNCIDFHLTSRIVKTASRLQVKQPLYTGSSNAWRKFAAQLGPVADAVATIDAQFDE